MTQDNNNPKHYIADEGKIFQRISNGFTNIENPYPVGSELILGEILIDQNGNKLEAPIEDRIEYYEEIDLPKEEVKENENEEIIQ
jgi:hypothetical protein